MTELVPTNRPMPPSSRSAAEAAKQPPDPAQVELLRRWRNDAPWVHPAVAYVAAKQGFEPSSWAGRAIASGAARAKVKKKGLGFHTIGDFVKGAADVASNAVDFVVPERVEDAVGPGLSAADDVAQAAARGVFTTLDSAYQTGQGLIRNLAATGGRVGEVGAGVLAGAAAGAGIGAAGGAVFGGVGALPGALVGAIAGGITGGAAVGIADPDIEGTASWAVHEWSTGGMALDKLLHGEDVDLGSGWLPAGGLAEAQAEKNRNVTIGGRGLTPGRLLASTVVEPGTTPYNIASGLLDLSAALGPAEPGAAALRSIGAVNAARRTVLVGQADGWLASEKGREVVEWLATHSDFDEVWKGTGRKIPVKVASRLADADSTDEVSEILRGELGITMRDAPNVVRLPQVRRNMQRVRILGEMPGSHLDVNDLDSAMRTFDAAQRNARLSPAQIAANNAKLAKAETPADIYRVVVDDFLSTQLKDELLTHKNGNVVARRLTRAWKDWYADLSKFFVDEIGENVAIPGAVLDATGKPLPSPHLYVEYLHNSIPLPDAREIRRATSTIGRLLNNGVADVPIATADAFMQSLWKPMVLLRGAWTVRVVGEEQIRMAASGMTSLVHHPLSHLALVMGRGKIGMAGDDLMESAEGVAALARGSAGFASGNRVRTAAKVKVTRGTDGFAQAWGDELAQLVTDPISKRLAGGVDWQAGDTIAALDDGTAITATGVPLEDVKAWFWGGTGRNLRTNLEGWGAPLGTRAESDAYIDSVFRRLQIKTGNDVDLLELVATGKIGDIPLIRRPGELDPDVVSVLDEIAADGIGPQAVKGDLWVTAKGKPSAAVAEKWDKAVETMFGALMSTPTNKLSRSPSFRNFYWQRAAELLPAMDSASQATALRNARAAKAPNLAALEAAAQKGTGTLKLADADLIAKGFGLDETRKLLYDLSRRSQFMDVHRLVFPFGEAWKEILTTWARIGVENPAVIRRGQQVVQGARQWKPEEIGLGEVMGEGHGFFYTDPSTGQEVFAYPMSGWATEKLLGQEVPFTGSVAGLSLATSVLPGVGPVVQMTAGSMLPKTPDYDWLRKLVFPFGETTEDEGFIESVMPAWFQKIRGSGLLADAPIVGDLPFVGADPTAQQERALAGAAFDLYSWEISSGRRKRPDSPEEIQAGIEANMEKARVVYLLRGVAQFGAPSAPTPEMQVVDKSGNLVVINELRNKYREIADEVGWADATTEFLDRFGDAALFAIQPRSKGLAYGLPSTKEADEWVRAHKTVRRRFPNTYGLWAPQGVEFDPTAYGRQFDTGERQALTVEQMVMQANARIAGHIYGQALEAAGKSPNARQRELLRDLRANLRDEFPGFGDTPGLAERADLDTAIAELKRGLTVPELATSEAGKGLAKYLEARDAARARAVQLGSASFRSSQRTEPLRLILRRAANEILRDHPAFGPMWDEVFSREMTEGESEEAAA